jgi:hypothetical protein
MINNCLLICIIIFGLNIIVKAGGCDYWLAQVDSKTEVNYELDEKDPRNITKGIARLLKLEGNKTKGLFSGATNDRVSHIFPESTVEICALYYISYLFYGDWEHANGIALGKKNRVINPPQTVKEPFTSYRKWFREIRRIGIERARSRKMEPLACSGISWY